MAGSRNETSRIVGRISRNSHVVGNFATDVRPKVELASIVEDIQRNTDTDFTFIGSQVCQFDTMQSIKQPSINLNYGRATYREGVA